MTGSRKVRMFYVACGTLVVALALCALPNVASAFGSFATAFGAVFAAAMAGNVGEHFARKDVP